MISSTFRSCCGERKEACREEYISHILKGAVRFGMTVSCGEDKPVYTFELTLSPTEKDREGGARACNNRICL